MVAKQAPQQVIVTRELAAEMMPPSPAERSLIKQLVERSMDASLNLDVRSTYALQACDRIEASNYLVWAEMLCRQNVALRARLRDMDDKMRQMRREGGEVDAPTEPWRRT